MATVQSSSLFLYKGLAQFHCPRRGGIVCAAIRGPEITMDPISFPNLSGRSLIEELSLRNGSSAYTISSPSTHADKSPDPVVDSKFYAIMDAVADRVEMHKNIGEQRDNWNRLLLTSLNTMTLAAATMNGLAAAASVTGGPLLALKVSSTVLYSAATGILLMMNKIQPSQLAEEQRNAVRLFKQLHFELQMKLSLGKVTINDVNVAMERVLALDKAYPLPLLGAMLEKFPSLVEPAVWWPQQKQRRRQESAGGRVEGNGWNPKIEEEMREIAEVLKRKDVAEYLRLGKKALDFNRILAISGPLLTALGALGSAFIGTSLGSAAVMVGVIAGALATVVNSIEHGCQVGMVFEMYRSNAGFFKLVQESIESNINERDVETRENGEVLELKLALQLGRNIKELKQLSPSEFGSKLF
ncbi:hypothetical protein SLEP1_g26695 [Rubroshorea leprosula]|uniref:F-box protein n=1 Tax=Rubroshorea leprosula TaxID=152421 RepID=A0AAV5JZ46_9ROSI|nr:hypothetical protein SLEP1_g26695 [Rubroshorea leprosula]